MIKHRLQCCSFVTPRAVFLMIFFSRFSSIPWFFCNWIIKDVNPFTSFSKNNLISLVTYLLRTCKRCTVSRVFQRCSAKDTDFRWGLTNSVTMALKNFVIRENLRLVVNSASGCATQLSVLGIISFSVGDGVKLGIASNSSWLILRTLSSIESCQSMRLSSPLRSYLMVPARSKIAFVLTMQ